MKKLFAALEIPLEDADKVNVTKVVQILTETLKPQESYMITQYCGVGCPEIPKRNLAQKHSLNEYRMRKIFSRALCKLQHPSRRNQLVALAQKEGWELS